MNIGSFIGVIAGLVIVVMALGMVPGIVESQLGVGVESSFNSQMMTLASHINQTCDSQEPNNGFLDLNDNQDVDITGSEIEATGSDGEDIYHLSCDIEGDYTARDSRSYNVGLDENDNVVVS